MNDLYPIFLKLAGRKCLVIGGGKIALEKINGLLKSKADLTVISPAISQDIQGLADAGKLNLILRPFKTTDLHNIFLVVSATDEHAVQQKVFEKCEQRNILCNVVDIPDRCSFYLGSVVTRGDLKIAISSNGNAPALSAEIRKQLKKQFGRDYARVTRASGTLRKKVRKAYPDNEEKRMQVMRKLTGNKKLVHALESGNSKAIEKILQDWKVWKKS